MADEVRHPQYNWSTHALQVPLETDPRGDEHLGHIVVPEKLAQAQRHTNEHHALSKRIVEAVANWERWKKKRGWVLQRGTVRIFQPVDAPKETPASESPDPEGTKRIYMAGRFVRETALYMPADLFEFKRDQATRYGVELEEQSYTNDPNANTDGDDTPAQRRERLGVDTSPVIKDGVLVHTDVTYKPLSETPQTGPETGDTA